MKETIRLYYELRKVWIWTLIGIITIIAISSMIFNIGGWYQAKHAFDKHFDAHHYYEMQDYARSLVGTKQAHNVLRIVNGDRGYRFVGNSRIKSVSKNAEVAYYILTVAPNDVGADESYKKTISVLPATFSQFRHEVLRYYVSSKDNDSNQFSSYTNGPSLFVAGMPTSKQICLPVTAKSSPNAGPFNRGGVYTHTWTFNQPLGLGSVLLAIFIGAVFFLLDQIHWINPYMLQRSKNGRYIALAKSLWWFALPAFLSCFYAFIEFVLKSFAIPAAFVNSDYGLFLSSLLVVLTTGFTIVSFGLLIDSFIGTVFGKIYTAVASLFAFGLAIASMHILVAALIYHLHLPLKPFMRWLDNTVNSNTNGFSWVALLIACIMFALAIFWYKNYSYDTDSRYVRQLHLKKPFFYFVICLAVWDFVLPLLLASWAPNESYFRGGQISSIVWWLIWGLGITLFTGWLIFKKPLKFSFLRRKN